MTGRYDVRSLQLIEADLLDKLQRCVPPVDQHRADLERVRSQIAHAADDPTAPVEEGNDAGA